MAESPFVRSKQETKVTPSLKAFPKSFLLIQLQQYCNSQHFLYDKVTFVHTNPPEAV